MSNNLGVRLTLGVLSGLSMGIYVPRTYQPKTYERSSLGGVINLAQFDTTFQKQAAAGCVGVSQTFTTAGTISFTPNCTGTLTFQVWSGGAGGKSGANIGGGASAYAEGALSVVNGSAWIGRVGAGGAAGTSGSISYLCSGGAGCNNTLTICSGAGLNNTNFTCADPGHADTGNGGATAQSVGVTLHNGGNGFPISVQCQTYSIQGAGGGAAGPQGDGANVSSKGDGGTADAGSGGAGGACSGFGAGGVGGSDAAHGGGGGGGSGAGTGGAGGVPGGGGGTGGVTGQPGGKGEVIVHSDASDVLAPVVNSGSGHHGCAVLLTA